MESENRTILFYDGDCGFCNRSVQFVLKHEKDHSILFSAIQSDFCKSFFMEKNLPVPDLSTFYFYNRGKLFERSNASFELLKFIKPPYNTLRFFRIVPIGIRDRIYNLIAKRRHKIMAGFCMIPSSDQKQRFLS